MTFILVAELAPVMAERGSGAIVNVGTVVADFGLAVTAIYGASKAALNLLTTDFVMRAAAATGAILPNSRDAQLQ